MAAPAATQWGAVVANGNSQGRLGIYVNPFNISDTVTRTYVEVWFWSKYSISDTGNTYYLDGVSQGARAISHGVATGAGWSEANQTCLGAYNWDYTRGTSPAVKSCSASFVGIDKIAGTVYASASWTIPAKPSYVVAYDANGGSGAPNSQTKWYGSDITIPGTIPVRSGYKFLGWGTSSIDTTPDYQPGGTYSANAGATLYAIWERQGMIWLNENGVNRHGLVWFNDNVVWRLGIPWLNEYGVWKRGGQ